MAETRVLLEFPVEGGNFPAAGEAASKVKKTLQKLGIDSDLTRRVSIATYEAEMNIVIHAEYGKITLQVDAEGIWVRAEDRGKGIPDIDQAMLEGFSTAPERIREMGFGAGMGLPNIKKCADQLEIKTKLNVGTTVDMGFYYPAKSKSEKRTT
ncbi:MAG: anti-sigma regulatory factor [Firmicutes bacterium]|nr:anti-sigma regulatory factor [Bacillota bacterium]